MFLFVPVSVSLCVCVCVRYSNPYSHLNPVYTHTHTHTQTHLLVHTNTLPGPRWFLGAREDAQQRHVLAIHEATMRHRDDQQRIIQQHQKRLLDGRYDHVAPPDDSKNRACKTQDMPGIKNSHLDRNVITTPFLTGCTHTKILGNCGSILNVPLKQYACTTVTSA